MITEDNVLFEYSSISIPNLSWFFDKIMLLLKLVCYMEYVGENEVKVFPH